MADAFEEVRQLQGEDFHQFLIAKGVELVCPACHSDALAIMADGPDGPLHVLAMHLAEPERIRGNQAALLALGCKHCGHVRHFHAINVVDWKEGRHGNEEG